MLCQAAGQKFDDFDYFMHSTEPTPKSHFEYSVSAFRSSPSDSFLFPLSFFLPTSGFFLHLLCVRPVQLRLIGMEKNHGNSNSGD